MGLSSKENFKALFEIAAAQEGYFTAMQAKQSGYSDASIVYHAKNGNWTKEWRGIYRLSHYPSERFDDYLIWYLWSCDRKGEPKGSYSHDTALSMHELSTWADSKTHMTVPRRFRRTAEIPSVLELHYADLKPHEIMMLNRVSVTTPLKTLTDLVMAQTVQRHHLQEAMQQCLERGLIRRSEIKDNSLLSKQERDLLIELLEEAHLYRTSS